MKKIVYLKKKVKGMRLLRSKNLKWKDFKYMNNKIFLEMGWRWQKEGHGAYFLSQIPQKFIYLWNRSHRMHTESWQISYNKRCKKDHHKLGRMKENKWIRTGLVYLGGSCDRGNVPPLWELPSQAGKCAWTDKELQRLREEYRSQLSAGRI